VGPRAGLDRCGKSRSHRDSIPDRPARSQSIADSLVIAESLDNGDKIDAIILNFSKAFDLVPHGRLLTKIANSGVNSRVVVWIRQFLLGRTQRVRVGGQLSAEVKSNVRCTARKRIRSSSVPSLSKWYLKEYGINY